MNATQIFEKRKIAVVIGIKECQDFCVDVLFSPHSIEEHVHGAPMQTPRSHIHPVMSKKNIAGILVFAMSY